jgi:hypothetical protein
MQLNHPVQLPPVHNLPAWRPSARDRFNKFLFFQANIASKFLEVEPVCTPNHKRNIVEIKQEDLGSYYGVKLSWCPPKEKKIKIEDTRGNFW